MWPFHVFGRSGFRETFHSIRPGSRDRPPRDVLDTKECLDRAGTLGFSGVPLSQVPGTLRRKRSARGRPGRSAEASRLKRSFSGRPTQHTGRSTHLSTCLTRKIARAEGPRPSAEVAVRPIHVAFWFEDRRFPAYSRLSY